MLYGILDRRTNTLTYARAGHELPILVNAEGQVSLAPYNKGQLLGVLNKPILDEQSLSIPPGGIMLYTDGVIDARHTNCDAFGLERLTAELPNLINGSAQEACDYLWRRLQTFQNKTPQEDDVTMVAVRSRL